MLPGIGQAIGSLIGPMISGLSKLFGGVSQAEKDARIEVDKYEQSLMATMTATQKTEAAGRQWAATNIVVRDAYLKAGYSIEQAQAAVDRLTAASHLSAEAAKAAAAEINAVFQENEADQKRALELATEYKIGIDQLGPTMRNQQLGDQARGIMNDFRVMTQTMELDFDTAAGFMGDKINAFAQTAIKTGFEVPAAMKPMLQQMVDHGQLLDENGKAYGSLAESGITFAESLSGAVDRLTAKFDQWMQRLLGVPSAIAAIPRDVDVSINGHWNIPDMPDSRDLEGHAAGGVFTREHLARIAEGGQPEIVGDVAFMSRALSGAMQRMGGSGGGMAGGGGDVHVTVNVDASGAFINDRSLIRQLTRQISEGIMSDAFLRQRFERA
jgi:hypothetical protein